MRDWTPGRWDKEVSKQDERWMLYLYDLNDPKIASCQGVTRVAIGNWRRRRGLPPNDLQNEPAEVRFMANIQEGEPKECWEWKAATTGGGGYGVFSDSDKLVLAHRFSYAFYRDDEPGELYVLHKCDNPPCVNPHHLYLGTQTENMLDVHQERWPSFAQ